MVGWLLRREQLLRRLFFGLGLFAVARHELAQALGRWWISGCLLLRRQAGAFFGDLLDGLCELELFSCWQAYCPACGFSRLQGTLWSFAMKQCHHQLECRRSNFRQLPLLEKLRLQLTTLGMSSVKVVLLHPTLTTEVAAGVAELEVLSMWNNQKLS